MALSALLVLFVSLIALREHRRANRLEAAHDLANEAADDWSRIAQAELKTTDLLRAALLLEEARYDAALKVLFVKSPATAIGAIDDIEAGRVPEYIDVAFEGGGSA